VYNDDVRVRLDGKVADKKHAFTTTRGVRQGCLLSPFLFNLVMDRVLRTTLPHVEGIPFVGHDGTEFVIKARGYADDIVIFSKNPATAQQDLIHFNDACKAAELTISTAKTEFVAMPDRRPYVDLPHPDNVALPNGVTRVPPEYDNAGALYFVHNRPAKRPQQVQVIQRAPNMTQEQAFAVVRELLEHAPPQPHQLTQNDPIMCPWPDCDHRAASVQALASHIPAKHHVFVNMLEQAPRALATTDIGEDPDVPNGEDRFFCVTCCLNRKRNYFAQRSTANTHWRSTHAMTHPIGNLMYTNNRQGGGTPLAGPDTDRQAAERTRAAHNLNFPRIDVQNCSITLDGVNIKRVQEFKYLGRIVTENNVDRNAVSARIAIAECNFQRMRPNLRQASNDSKLRMYRAIVEAQLMYGLSTCQLTKAQRQRLDRVQVRHLRNLLGMNPIFLEAENRLNYPRTSAVLRAANAAPASDTIDFAAVRFAGHVLRRPEGDACKLIQKATIPGFSGRERHAARRVMMKVEETMMAAGLTVSDAASRATWRRKNRALLETKKRAAHRAAGDGNG
jgi:hypothetical protein